MGAVGAADDRPGPGGGLAGAAFAVQLDDDVGAQGGVLLAAADPLLKLRRRPRPRRERIRVEGGKHRVQRRGDRLAGALAGGGDGALADGFGVADGHAQAVAGEGFAQRWPGGLQLLRGDVDAAELLSQREGAFGFGAVRKEAAGLPAHSLLGMQGPRSPLARARPSIDGGLTAYRPLRKGCEAMWLVVPGRSGA
jgi:hypothetical protein